MAQEDRVAELEAALDGKSPEPAATESTDQPEATPEPEAGQTQEQEAPQTDEDSFYDFDPSSVPEDATREWLARRHHEMQAAFTKKTQTVAEQRKEAEKIVQAFNDPDQLAHLLKERGFDLEDDDDEFDDDFDDTPNDFRSTQEWQQFLQFQGQLHQAQQHEQEEQEFRKSVKDLETQIGREIDDDEWDDLWTLGQAGIAPDAAWERINRIAAKARKGQVAAKQAPQVSKVGKSATQVPDLSDERARVDFLADAIEANRQD